jgi:hypothetical protein
VDDEHREAMRAFVDHGEAHASRRRLLAGGLGAAGALFGAVALSRPAAAQTATTTGGSTATTNATSGSAPATTSAVTAGPAGGTPTSVATSASSTGGAGTTVVAASSTNPAPTAAGSASTAGGTTTVPPRSPQPADIPFLVFAQSLELALVSAYGTALGANKLDDQTGQLVAIFQRHHREHAQSMTGIAGRTATGQPNPGLVAQYGPQLQSASSQKALLQVLFNHEQTAAATYILGLATLVGTEPAALAASIQPIEARHAVVLGQALDLDLSAYLPTFEPTTGGATPAQFPVEGA